MRPSSRFALGLAALTLLACAPAGDAAPAAGQPAGDAGQAAVTDKTAQKSIAHIASESADHTTLVAALKAVNWLDALANPGPFTVFAPVNAAFEKLPAGTVETLLKPENAGQLRTVLLHHVLTSVYTPEQITDGMTLPMLDGGPVTVARNGDEIVVDGAKVLASVRAGNGMVYVVDGVFLPKTGQ